jgi:hypothetical protein
MTSPGSAATPALTRVVPPDSTYVAGRGLAWIGPFHSPGTDAFAVEGRPDDLDPSFGRDWISSRQPLPGATIRLGGTGDLTLDAGPPPDDTNREDARDLTQGAISGIGDVNGDGLADAMLDRCIVDGAASAHGLIRPAYQQHLPVNDLVPLGASGWCQVATGRHTFGRTSAGAGDLNGDGLNDAIVTFSRFSLFEGPGTLSQAWIVFGARSGERPAQRLIGGLPSTTPSRDGRLVTSAAGVGDVTGDGIDDLAILTPTSGVPTLWIVPGPLQPGGPIDPAHLPANSFPVGETPIGANTVQPLGDIDGDGFDDFGLGVKFVGGYISGRFESQLIYGAPPGTPNRSTRLLWNGAIAGIGTPVAAGDLDHDGLPDILIPVPGKRRAVLLYGRTTQPASIDLATLSTRDGFSVTGPDPRDSTFGAAVGAAPPWIGPHTNGILVSNSRNRVYIDTDPPMIDKSAAIDGSRLTIRVRCPNTARTGCTSTLAATGPRCERYAAERRLATGTTTSVTLSRTRRAKHRRCAPTATAKLIGPHRSWKTTQRLRISTKRS